MDVEEAHHPFCNRFLEPREQCKMCERFYEKYPLHDEAGNELTGEELAAKFFPDAIQISHTRTK